MFAVLSTSFTFILKPLTNLERRKYWQPLEFPLKKYDINSDGTEGNFPPLGKPKIEGLFPPHKHDHNSPLHLDQLLHMITIQSHR